MSLIYSTELNAPTPEQLAEGAVPLQGFWWTPQNPEEKRVTPYDPTVQELLDFMDRHGIPRCARVEYWECGSHTLHLAWKVA